jgi:hypothetical protein
MTSIQYGKVQERLSLAKRIFEQGEQLRGRSLVQHIGDNGWTHPYIQHDALVNYLLLTCFDILGQPEEWLGFNSWLTSSRTKSEREEATSLISESETPIKATEKIYTFYQNKYGVKSSFYRFINEVLDEELQKRLLSSVRIEKINENLTSEIIDCPVKKKSFLYESRNFFTHQGELTGSPAGGLFGKIIEINIDGEEETILWGYENVRIKKKCHYSVRRWPFELFEIISKVIEQPINIYDFDIECLAEVHFKCTTFTIKKLNFKDLKDTNRLINFVKNQKRDGVSAKWEII